MSVSIFGTTQEVEIDLSPFAKKVDLEAANIDNSRQLEEVSKKIDVTSEKYFTRLNNEITKVDEQFAAVTGEIEASSATVSAEFAEDISKLQKVMTSFASHDDIAEVKVNAVSYADDKADEILSGQLPFTGDIDMGKHRLANVKTPVTHFDAANKKYVDRIMTIRTDTATMSEVATTQIEGVELKSYDYGLTTPPNFLFTNVWIRGDTNRWYLPNYIEHISSDARCNVSTLILNDTNVLAIQLHNVPSSITGEIKVQSLVFNGRRA